MTMNLRRIVAVATGQLGSFSRAQAHEHGRPVVVRAGSAEAVKAALARPEVASVLVPQSKRELVDLDLTELTYG